MIISSVVLDDLRGRIDFMKLEKAKNLSIHQKVKLKHVAYLNYHNFDINSEVKSDNRIYSVKVAIQKSKIDVVNCKCQCLESISKHNICEHMAATILESAADSIGPFTTKLEIEKLTKDFKFNLDDRKKHKERYEKSLKIIEDFKNEIGSEDSYINNLETENKDNILNNSVRIIPIVKKSKYDNEFELSFQIGQKQLYKIKNLPDFSGCIDMAKNYRYGAKLEFYHNIEKFDENSKKVIPYIVKYGKAIKYANENAYIGSRYYTPSKVLNTSNIVLNKEAFDELFDIYINDNMIFEIDGIKRNVVLIDKEPDIKFEIEKIDNNDYRLTTKFDKWYYTIFGNKYAYILTEDIVYKCSKKTCVPVIKLLKNLKHQDKKEIIFNGEDVSALFSVIIPKIKNNIILKNLEEEVEKYSPKELNVKLFLDFTNVGNVVSNVKFCYDEFEFNPFKIEEKIDFVRNLNGENEVLKLFKNTGFEIIESHMTILDEEKIYNFLSNDINKYMQKFEVMATDNFKTKQVRQPKIGTLGIKVENNLLKVDLDNLDFDKSELKSVMQKYNLKKKYHRLKDGSFLDLQDNEDIDFINSFTEGMDVDYKDISKGNIRVPVYRTAYLEKLLDNVKNTEIIKNDEYKEIINKIEDKEDNENILIPKKFNKTLRTYQKTGYKWLKVLDEYRFGGILADDMGLGKTLQLIVIVNSYIESTKSKDRIPSLVVCPSSLSINWRNEIKKFSPNIKVLVVSGKAEDRKEQIQDLNKYDLVITSYDLLKRDIDIYNELKYTFKYVIADEAQYIKNSNTKNATAIKSIDANTRFALTGTPIENSLSELWSIFDYIMPGYLFSYSKFKKNFETPIVKDNDEKTLKRLKMLIEPFVLRRLKKEVLTELPDKTISVLNNEMVEEQNKIYLSYLMNAKKEMQEEINNNGFEKSQIKILSLLTRLRQICCHPSLFIENYKGDSSKLNQCIEIIKDATQSGHKILLFSQFTSMFEILQNELNKEGIKYFKLTGQTKVDERIKLVEEFNENKEIQVFLISLKAGRYRT
jgi:hypothetical protein